MCFKYSETESWTKGGETRKALSKAGTVNALQKVFNPTVARYGVVMGWPYGHKVQKHTLHDTKSDYRVNGATHSQLKTWEELDEEMVMMAVRSWVCVSIYCSVEEWQGQQKGGEQQRGRSRNILVVARTRCVLNKQIGWNTTRQGVASHHHIPHSWPPPHWPWHPPTLQQTLAHAQDLTAAATISSSSSSHVLSWLCATPLTLWSDFVLYRVHFWTLCP